MYYVFDFSIEKKKKNRVEKNNNKISQSLRFHKPYIHIHIGIAKGTKRNARTTNAAGFFQLIGNRKYAPCTHARAHAHEENT